jgi:PPOX class probable F420-dependent enzyme
LIELPPAVIDFVRRPNPAVIACIRPDGYPMSVATWYDWEDGMILVNMHEARSRLRWIRANPKVSITVLGHGANSDWYRHVSFYGLVVRIADDPNLADIDRLCLRYTGKPFSNRNAKRVSAWIDPHGWHGWDDEGVVASTNIRT